MSETSVSARARFTLRRVTAGDRTFGDEIRAGLTAVQKYIPPRYFYDQLGSALFEAICHLPEYYLTRAEIELLRRHARDIAGAAGIIARVVELGSGNARKTRLLLDEIARAGGEIEYVPVDIDPNVLERAGRELLTDYPTLRVSAVCSDFARPSRALSEVVAEGRTLAVFLGSTVGNFAPRRAAAMLRDLRSVLKPGDVLLLGVDLKKSKEMLDAAYNDVLGITAAFNLNLLLRINRELGGHFDLHAFGHRAFYDAEQSRIEMHLVSLREQSVHIDALNLEAAFGEGETIHTENSYKYDEEDLAQIVAGSGLEIVARWTDSHLWFADVLLRAR